jgi:CrcB protein
MRNSLLVFPGGGRDGVRRHFVNLWSCRRLGLQFPWGVLVINVSGCFAMGLVAGYLALKAVEGWSQSTCLFLTTGAPGGRTTFSAFSRYAARLVERGAVAAGAVAFSILGPFLGLSLMRALT